MHHMQSEVTIALILLPMQLITRSKLRMICGVSYCACRSNLISSDITVIYVIASLPYIHINGTRSRHRLKVCVGVAAAVFV